MSDNWSKHCEPPRHVWAWTTSMGLNEPLRCWCGQTLSIVTYDPQGTWRLEVPR